MGLQNVFVIRRALVVRLALSLSLLCACSDYSPAPTYPDAPPPGPTLSAVDIAFCRGGEPTWVAFQDGDGAWTRAQPTTSGAYTTFHRDFTSTRGAVARVQTFASGLAAVSILYGLPSELEFVSDTGFGQCEAGSLNELSGTVTGLDANEVALVSAGNSVRDLVFPERDGAFRLTNLLAGPQEFLVTRGTVGIGLTPETGMILRRVPALPDGATLAAFDFRSPEAFLPEQHVVTFAGLAGEGVTANTGLRTAHSNNTVTFFSGAAPAAATHAYHAIPVARLEPGEMQSIGASTTPVGNVVRSATAYFRSPADRTLTFGAMPSAPVLSVVSSAPTARLRARFTVQADYDRYTSINFQQGQDVVVSLSMTQAYAERNIVGLELVVPELTGVQGFDPRWALHSGTSVIWTTARVGGTVALGFNPVTRDGDVRRSGSDAGFITP